MGTSLLDELKFKRRNAIENTTAYITVNPLSENPRRKIRLDTMNSRILQITKVYYIWAQSITKQYYLIHANICDRNIKIRHWKNKQALKSWYQKRQVSLLAITQALRKTEESPRGYNYRWWHRCNIDLLKAIMLVQTLSHLRLLLRYLQVHMP